MADVTDFIDKNGLIKPRKAWQDSGNGMLYTVIYNLGSDPNNLLSVTQLYMPSKGVLYRTPENSFGQESHDNYLAFATWLLYLDAHNIAEHVLMSSVAKFGFMQNTFNKGDFLRSFLWRFPFLWFVFIATAIPKSYTLPRLLTRYVLRALVLLNRVDVTDASAIQLQWLQYKAISLLGDDRPMLNFLTELQRRKMSLSGIMKDYYDLGHPIVDMFKLQVVL